MNVIVAVDANWAIGLGGDQLCYIPADLKRFQRLTTGHPVLLGRKTLATFPGGRPLKNRRNLILSADPAFAPEGAEVFRTLEDALAAAPADTFVIGGESVYRALFPHIGRVFVTKLRCTPVSDAFFPDLDADPAWRIVEAGEEQSEDGIAYRFLTYERI